MRSFRDAFRVIDAFRVSKCVGDRYHDPYQRNRQSKNSGCKSAVTFKGRYHAVSSLKRRTLSGQPQSRFLSKWVAGSEWRVEGTRFGLYPCYQSTGAPSFAFLAKVWIVKSHPSTSHYFQPT